MIDAETTARLLDGIREQVAACEPANLVAEHMLPSLVSGLLHPDADAGRELVRAKATDNAFMLTLLQRHHGERSSQTIGEAALRRVPHLAWHRLAELLGEEELRARVLGLGDSADIDDLDAETKSALELALRIARGETQPGPD